MLLFFGMKGSSMEELVSLDLRFPIWDRFYSVAPLIVVGSKGDGDYDLAPKHLALPLGWDNFFGFICAPSHQTYKNIKADGFFTVSFVKPNDAIIASLAASPRCGEHLKEKPIVKHLPTSTARSVNALILDDSYLYIECERARIIDGFGRNSLIVGEITEAYAQPGFLRSMDKDDAELVKENPLLVYLPPNRFAAISQSLAFPFPKDFSR